MQNISRNDLFSSRCITFSPAMNAGISLTKSQYAIMTAENTILQWSKSLPHTFETASTRIFANLAREYDKNLPDQAKKIPFETLVRGMEAKQKVSGSDALVQLHRAYKAGVNTDFSNVPFIVALSYCIQACRTYESGSKEEGWSFLTESMYWLSTSLTKDVVLDLGLKGMIKFESEKASSGGQARGQKAANVKKKIAELVKEKRPPKGWQSAAAAARIILAEEEVRKMMSEEAGLKEDRFEKTVQEWLGKMPEFIDARRRE